jgi:hypothetical protein
LGALGATLGAAVIVDQVKEAKNAGPQTIDPEILGKYGGLRRPVWIEMAKRLKNREEVQNIRRNWWTKPTSQRPSANDDE